LTTHTGIAEKILLATKQSEFRRKLEAEQNLLALEDLSNDFIEECICKQMPLVQVLRLLCLQSLTNGGIKQKQHEFFKREILQTYGYEYLFTMDNLEKLGLFKKNDSKSSYSTLKKSMNLIIEDIDENKPTDIAFVYSGYAPISVRLVEWACQPGGWKSKEEVLKLLPGPVVEEIQSQSESKNINSLFVYFIGGITYAEVAALRWLSKNGVCGEVMIATTKFENGTTLLNSIIEKN